jgi:hypothetical protein
VGGGGEWGQKRKRERGKIMKERERDPIYSKEIHTLEEE